MNESNIFLNSRYSASDVTVSDKRFQSFLWYKKISWMAY